MTIHKHVRTLASAALLALAIASVPIASAHASRYQTRQSCEAAGFSWSNTYGCADRLCERDGGYYRDGQQFYEFLPSGRARVYICDGYSGEWIAARTAEPQVPTAPRPTTNGR